MGEEREDGRNGQDDAEKKRGEAAGGREEADPEPHAYDAGLSEEERIGRSLDEISDIIHDVLSDPKGPEAETGGDSGGPAPGPGAGESPQEARAERAARGGGDPKAGAGQDAPPAGQADRASEGAEEAVPGGGAASIEAEAEGGPGGGGGGGGGAASIEAEAEAEGGPGGGGGGSGGGGAASIEADAEAEGGPGGGGGGGAAESENAHGDVDRIPNPVIESILGPSEVDEYVEGGRQGGKTYSYDDFIDERILISRDAFGRKEMKIKVLEVSDEKAPTSWKLGDRVKVDKILVTVKHLETQQVEEGEFDIASIEKEIARDRHYSSTNRWVPTTDIKNGYVAGSRHTSLISDAVALEYIIF